MPKPKHRPKPKTTPKKKKPPKWQNFEKIVAAIHAAEDRGATVIWNNKISGRQFDVTIKFKRGFYEYLTFIECRDYGRALAPEKVEAFVTKARDHKANKMIMVTASGYQSGAKDVALRHGVQLFTLKQVNQFPEDILTDVFFSVVVIRPVAFRRFGDVAFRFSDNISEVDRQLDQIRLSTFPDAPISEVILRPVSQLLYPSPLPGVPDAQLLGFSRATKEPKRGGFKVPINTLLTLQNSGQSIPVDEFLFLYWYEDAQLLDFRGIDPTVYASFGKQYEYKDELNNETYVIDPTGLALGIDTELKAGHFYTQPQFVDFVYYCEEVDGKLARLLLIHSIQHGDLVRLQYDAELETAPHYIEIIDELELERARGLLKTFIDRRAADPGQRTDKGATIWIGQP